MVAGTAAGGLGTESGSGSGADQGAIQGASFASSWLADLATGDSIRTHHPLAFETALLFVVSLILSFMHL